MSDLYRTPDSNLVPELPADALGGSVEATLQGQFEFSIGAVISEAFQRINGIKGVVIGGFVLAIGLQIGIGFVFSAMLASPDPVRLMLTEMVSQLVQMLVGTPLFAGVSWLVLRHLAGRSVSFGDVFSQYDRILPLFFMSLLMGVMIFIGFMLLIVPGIYLSIAYLLAIPLMIDKNLGIWDALETSRQVITKCWWRMLGLMLLIMLIMIPSFLLLMIPLIWTAPAAIVAMMLVYRNLCGITLAAQD